MDKQLTAFGATRRHEANKARRAQRIEQYQ
jgi:hypothetical protein